MAAQESREMSMYRLNAVIGNQIRLLYCVGWSMRDVQEKLQARMRSEGHTLYTLSFLDRRPLT